MKLSKFKFNLPSELIALHPAKNRDESRLMVVHRDTGEIEHREFKDILDYYGKGALGSPRCAEITACVLLPPIGRELPSRCPAACLRTSSSVVW